MSTRDWRRIGLFGIIAVIISFFDTSFARKLVLMAMAVLGIVAAPRIASIVNDWS